MAADDAAQPSPYIIDLDANNIYGWTMSQTIPIGGFARIIAYEAMDIDSLTETEAQPVGYFVEGSITSSVELHEAHNDYPLAAERLDVQVTMLSDNLVELPAHCIMSRFGNSTKRDVHRVNCFQQSRWLALYREQLEVARCCQERVRKGVFQADEQLQIKEIVRESEDAHRPKTHHK